MIWNQLPHVNIMFMGKSVSTYVVFTNTAGLRSTYDNFGELLYIEHSSSLKA